MNMIVGKKQIVLASLVAALGAAVYLNYQFADVEGEYIASSANTENTQVENYGDAAFVDTKTAVEHHLNTGETVVLTDNSEYFSEGVIGAEERDVTSHLDDLSYLLTVYFRGPLDPDLSSPFPMGCRILEIQLSDGQLTIWLNPILAEKSEMDITLACACLALTCLDFTDVDSVQIESRNLEEDILFSRTFTRDNLFLNDVSAKPSETTQ